MHELNAYIDIIKSGGVVAFPTETVYGLGADAWNPTAIQKVFEIKGRPSDNPLIVHISDMEQALDFTDEVPELAIKLMDTFWPGPLSLVLPKKLTVLDAVTAGLNTVAIRMPNHKTALEFIEQTGPLVAPSANKSGRPSPTKVEHVIADFGPDFPVIDGGVTTVGLESTVLDLSSDVPAILRPGKIGATEIEQALGVKVRVDESSTSIEAPKSPGQKYSHYKPAADVFYGEIDHIKKDGLYLTQDYPEQESHNLILYKGDLEKLSRELYDRFRQADLQEFSFIYIQSFEHYKDSYPSLYEALKNRIQKAISKT